MFGNTRYAIRDHTVTRIYAVPSAMQMRKNDFELHNWFSLQFEELLDISDTSGVDSYDADL